MYLRGMSCCSECAPGGLAGLFDSLGGAIGSAFGGPLGGALGSALGGAFGGDGGSAGGAPGQSGGNITVATSTNVNTSVSPQISPQFIQQDHPVDSPVNAGATMGTPVTGAMPGFDAASGYLPTGLPALPTFSPNQSIGLPMQDVVLLGGAGLLLAFALSRRGKKKHFGKVR